METNGKKFWVDVKRDNGKPINPEDISKAFWSIYQQQHQLSHTENCIQMTDETWFCEKDCPLREPAKYLG